MVQLVNFLSHLCVWDKVLVTRILLMVEHTSLSEQAVNDQLIAVFLQTIHIFQLHVGHFVQSVLFEVVVLGIIIIINLHVHCFNIIFSTYIQENCVVVFLNSTGCMMP